MPNVRITTQELMDCIAECRRVGSQAPSDDLVDRLCHIADSDDVLRTCDRRVNEMSLLAAKMAYRTVPYPASGNPIDIIMALSQMEEMKTIFSGLLDLVYMMAVYDERESNEQRNQQSPAGPMEQPPASTPSPN